MTSAGRVEVFADAKALADAAAAMVAAEISASIDARGRCVMALAGGATPRATYQRLAAHRDVDWERVHVVWGDERCVPADHPASNYRMAREALLDQVPIPATNVHRLHGEAPPPFEAIRYDAVLHGLLGTSPLDLVILGLGADGHTASLFPDAAPFEPGPWVRPVVFDDARGARLTMTETLLDAARVVMFLAPGAEKASILSRVIGDGGEGGDWPARRIATRAADVRWLVDREARPQPS